MIKITKELQQTVASHPKVAKIHFDSQGRHYFNVFKLIREQKESEDDEETALFGTGEFSHRRIIPGLNPDKLTEVISKGVADTEIVKTMTRDEVLKFKVVDETPTVLNQVMNSTPEEKAAIASILGFTPDILEAVKAFAESQKKPTPNPAPIPTPAKK